MRHGVVVATLLGAALLAPGPGIADVSVNVSIGPPPPIVVAAPPPLVVVPGVPQVHYVPTLSVDVFVFGGRWYYLHEGHWFVGPSHRGPWHPIAVARVPGPVLAVPAAYYKIPPGHWRQVGGGPPGHARSKKWKD
jgi:hypothetical protein